ncbi:exodeoxyribonuclease VII large subunit [Pseudomarimonas arenosa]|uniref:Exodeoxyribonuclease 7 large subunit n=1 Tax=Pseudomarimonas arenosa TaxID=2774145 RepID=A0AAW3ZI04_9GAMM|nr:exodeoxyribonuclease VII large subunit [Pseudomarimonas arenosa]MBD8524332.1 exodeoxyribonuclease VII large subunit [Pseudomarimonas arenosa]
MFPKSEPASRLLTPTQLNALARSLLEDSFPLVEVLGEISNFACPSSGHLYFTLKDRNAQVRCAMFRQRSQWMRFKPENGQSVQVRGRLTLYEPRGDYQLVLEHMQPAGEGELLRAFQALKEKLQAEGLFDAERKKPIPTQIKRLGVLSSAGGAAIHDVLSVLRRRWPLLQVELLPIPVQGKDAPSQIGSMLTRADESQRYSVLLLTRGGGSLEDLAAFNDERLARTIAACVTPVVSAVGHEIDFTIADFVADLRCPTPSAAAETLSPDGQAIGRRIDELGTRAARSLRNRLQTAQQRLDHLQLRLRNQHPQARLQLALDRGRALHARITKLGEQVISRQQQHLNQLLARLSAKAPGAQLGLQRRRVDLALHTLQAQVRLQLQRAQRSTQALGRTLHAVSPLATLDRGYAILADSERTLRSVASIKVNDPLRARLADGELGLRVTAVSPAPPHKMPN